MKFVIATKEYMTQMFDENGKAYAGTVVTVLPAVVVNSKTKEKDGYDAVRTAYGEKKVSKISKPMLGVTKSLKEGDLAYAKIREFRLWQVDDEAKNLQKGDAVDISSFKEGDSIEVSGISKGKGFQGVVKRHGFHGGRRSHGQKHSEREPGSIGAGGLQRVLKGLRMAGRMGSNKITVKNLKVLKIDEGNRQMIIKGAIPGRKGTLIEIKG